MINAIIVDDEEKSRATLNTLVARHCPSVTIDAMCDSVDAAIRAIEKYKPSLVFLASNVKSKSAKIAIPTFDGLQMINADDIIKCIANESYTHIFLLRGQKITVSKLLKEYEELLDGYNFFRVHNSSLINLKHVTKYIKGDGGYVVMADGSNVEISRRKRNELLNKLSLVQL
jgi:DNA-binding LytR/AlgR family response regulator